MGDMDVTLSIELRSEYVDTAGVKRHVTVDIVADYLQLQGEQFMALQHGSPVFTAQRADVIGVRVTGQTPAAPPRFADREDQPWTDDEDEALRELSSAGASVGRMTHELGRRHVEIHKRLRRLDLPQPRQ